MISRDPNTTQPAPSTGASGDVRSGSSVVSVVATTPETAVSDMGRAMALAGVGEFLSPDIKTLLKVNISWQHWYPGCSTTPWQIEGVAKALEAMGHKDLVAAHNGTVVVNSYEGEFKNKHKAAQEKVGLPDQCVSR